MEFGVFAQLFVPKFERAADPQRRAQAHHAQRRDRQGGRPERASSTCGARSTTSSTSTRTCPDRRPSSATARAITERVHLGSAIFNITPQVNKPVRIAENVALLDHLTEQPLRVRHRPRAARPPRCTASTSPTSTRPRRCGARPSPRSRRCGRPGQYSYEGKYFRVPEREVFPKPYGPAHPAMWVAAGSPPTFAEAAELGLGAFCFTTGAPGASSARSCRATRTTSASATPGRRLHQRQHHGRHQHALHGGSEEGLRGRLQHGDELLHVARLPLARQHPEARRASPSGPNKIPEPTPEMVEQMAAEGFVVIGDPDDCAKGVQKWADEGFDQLTFSPTTNTLPTDVIVQLDGAVRARGHPAVRQGPGALHHPVPRGSRGQAPTSEPDL